MKDSIDIRAYVEFTAALASSGVLTALALDTTASVKAKLELFFIFPYLTGYKVKCILVGAGHWI